VYKQVWVLSIYAGEESEFGKYAYDAEMIG